MTDIIKDSTFLKGFKILRSSLLEDNLNGLLNLPYGNLNEPEYRLAEYFSKMDLNSVRDVDVFEDGYLIGNDRKGLIRDEEGRLTMAIDCLEEYDHPRLEGEPWPHLLIEQRFEDLFLKDIKSLVVDMDLDFLAFENYMEREERNDLHTFQVSLYFAIGDANPKSEGYRDFYWFGLPMIDVPRYKFPKAYCSEDIGKEDATHKLIYSIDPHIYMKDQFLVGDNLSFRLDVRKYMDEGFAKAKELGFLKNTKQEDLAIFSFNFGFEVTGTFAGKMRINHFHIHKDE